MTTLLVNSSTRLLVYCYHYLLSVFADIQSLGWLQRPCALYGVEYRRWGVCQWGAADGRCAAVDVVESSQGIIVVHFEIRLARRNRHSALNLGESHAAVLLPQRILSAVTSVRAAFSWLANSSSPLLSVVAMS